MDEDFELEDEDFDDDDQDLESALSDIAEDKGGEGGAEEEKPPEPPAELVAALRKNEQLQGWAAKMRHQNEALQRNQQRLEQRQEKLLAALAEATGIDPKTIDPDAQITEPEPNKADDPAGYIIHHMRQQLSGVTQELDKAKNEAAQQQAIRDTAEKIRSFHEQDAARFGQEHPDYDQAEQFVFDLIVEAESKQLAFHNPGADPVAIQRQAERNAIEQALGLQVSYARDGRSLAEATYNRAVELGFQANGSAKPAATPARRGPAATMIERRKKAGRPLSAAPTGSSAKGRGVASLEALAALDDDDFDAAVGDKDFAKLVGRLSVEA